MPIALGSLLLALPLLGGCPAAEAPRLPETPAASGSAAASLAPASEREGWLVRTPVEPPMRCPAPNAGRLDVWCNALPAGAVARLGNSKPGSPSEPKTADLGAHRKPIVSVAVSSDGEWVATADGDEVRLWQMRSGKPLQRLTRTAGGEQQQRVAFVPGSRLLLVAASCALHVHDLGAGRARPPIAFAPIVKDDAGRTPAADSTDASADRAPAEQGCDEPVGIAVASDGDEVAVTTSAGLLRRFRLSTASELRPIRVAEDERAWSYQPARPAFTGDGTLIAVSPHAPWGPILVLRADDGAAHAQVLPGSERLADFDAAPRGTELAVLTGERIAVIDARTGNVLRSSPLEREISNALASIRFDPDGKRLLVVSRDGLVAFDVSTLRPTGTIVRGAEDGVDHLVAFARGGLWVHPETAVRPTLMLVRQLPAATAPTTAPADR